MKKLIKHIIIGVLPVLLVLLIILSINVLVSDWRYAHKTHANFKSPYDWASYKFEISIYKFILSFLNNNKKGLPAVRIYISEKSQQSLLMNTPNSTKKWVRGYYLLDNDNLKTISIRHRGDNPKNWMFEKKSWRIKTRKDEIFYRTRYFDYYATDIEKYSLGKIANRMGLLSPKVRLVELFINDESSGIFVETEKLNEGFLRRNNIMPINLYKGDPTYEESPLGINSFLFNSPGIWNKLAYFNQVADYDKSDLKEFLSLLRKAESDIVAFNELLERADTDLWAKTAACLILTQNYHNDETHNIRLAIDPWSGIVYPIIIDPLIADADGTFHNKNKGLPLETSANSLFSLLNRSSLFIDNKYEKLIEYVNNSKILTEEANSIRSMENAIHVSEKRDVTFLRLLYKSIDWSESLKKRKIIRNTEGKIDEISLYTLTKVGRENFAKYLEQHQANILEKLYVLPDVNWFKNINGFSIFINSEVPVSDLVINYKSNVPKWISIDINGNGVIDDNEYKFRPDKNGNLKIPARLYSNRISHLKSVFAFYTPVKTVKTKFNFISENSLQPDSISGNNPFSGERFILDIVDSKAVLPTKYNIPIYSDNRHILNELVEEFSGTINVSENVIINTISKIHPGTKFKLDENASIIFKNKVLAEGTVEKPIIFEKKNSNTKPWGTIALLGNKTQGSKFNNIIMKGGSGSKINEIYYTSMFSLHNTKDIEIKNLEMKNNYKYDDMLHIVYCDNIKIDNAILKNAHSDAIDVDMSKNIVIRNSIIIKPGNDSIDFMESEALVESSYMTGSGDKAISAGENSNVMIYNSLFYKNNIGLATKDGSNAYILYSKLENNKTQLSAYKKNWQYGGGGSAQVFNSYFVANTNHFNSGNKSKILIDDSSIVGEVNLEGKDLIFQDHVDFFDSKNISSNQNISIEHPLFLYILSVKNKNKRGSDLSSKKFTKWNQ